MDTLTPDALGWALAHIEKYGDTDIFPVPFEYKCIKAQWDNVIKHLGSIDLETHETRSALRLLIPKPGFGFRVATQLDPYDSLLYLAMTYESAAAIEALRAKESMRVACSYRVNLTADGTLFRVKTGWPDYHSRSKELASRPEFNYVVTADISDFYNQIYHHRVQNALEAAGVDFNRSRNTEKFLGSLTAKQSRGIPVGPAGSILLAEACLADVDSFLLRKGYEHTRYVDDFRIFVPDRMVAVKALYDLTEYLYSSHRLPLQGAKTQLHDTSKFIKKELVDPEESEFNKLSERLNELVGETAPLSSYSDPEELEVTPEMENHAVHEVLVSMFREVISARPVHLGFSRYLLRRARVLRTRVLLPDVLDNIDRLLPVLRDVILYLLTVYPKSSPGSVGSVLTNFLEKSDYRALPFVQRWILHALSLVPGFCSAQQALKLAENSHPEIRDRYGALIARTHRTVDWVRERKETWANSGPWSQRAIIWAGAILPSDERRHWLKPITKSPVHLNAIVARTVF